MPYLFTCPHCQTKTLVDDHFSGHSGQCVSCAQPIEVPHFLSGGQAEFSSRPAPRTSLGPQSRRMLASTVGVVLLVAAAGIFYQYGSPIVSNLATRREQGVAVRNLELIASALNAYAADHGVYPMPIVRDANGQAMHSWRVAILPYLNQQDLYNSFKFNEPWDSPHNLTIANTTPDVFGNSTSGAWSGYQNRYHLVSGDRTLFPASGPIGPKQVLDDPTKTALVVEALSKASLNVSWTMPDELSIQSMTGLIGTNPGIELGSVTEGGAAIATVDGRGHFLPESTAPEIVLALLTASGGEPLADDVLD